MEDKKGGDSSSLRERKGEKHAVIPHLPTLSSARGSHWLILPKSQKARDYGKYNFLQCRAGK